MEDITQTKAFKAMQVNEFETDESMKEIDYYDIRSNCSSGYGCAHHDEADVAAAEPETHKEESPRIRKKKTKKASRGKTLDDKLKLDSQTQTGKTPAEIYMANAKKSSRIQRNVQEKEVED